jgi:peptidoglycan/LPS O-acetylase OafA/YrhL
MATVMEPTGTRRPAPQPQPTRPSPGADLLTERIPTRTALTLGGAWLVLGAIAMLLEPAPSDADAFPWYATVLAYVFFWSGAAMLAGLIGRRRLGIAASIPASIALTASSVACPVSGHHAFGPWWLGQMACSLVLVGLTVVLWTSTRPQEA